MLFLRRCTRIITIKDATRCSVICRYYSKQDAAPKKTCLYDFHVANGGKMVDFAGWLMPVQYSDLTHVQSHHHTRDRVSIFDVSHMLQTKVLGKDRVQFMESLTVSDVAGLQDNQGTLSLFTNRDGGIIDDLIITRTTEGYLYVVSNAGCADKDYALMKCKAEECRSAGMDVVLEPIKYGLIAVQGPEMVKALQPGLDIDLSTLPFMMSRLTSVFGVPECRVTRCGYTGEDGVEISVPEDKTAAVTEALLSSTDADVKLAGLGARDSLRLEAGLCLYGNDIDDTTTPIEATLAWTVGKRRREKADFPGAQKILNQLKQKPSRKRVGIVSTGPPARAGTPIFDGDGQKQIGQLSSGCPSPCLKKNVAMGYIETPFAKNNTHVKFEIRKKLVDAVVSKMPFVKCNYFTGK